MGVSLNCKIKTVDESCAIVIACHVCDEKHLAFKVISSSRRFGSVLVHIVKVVHKSHG
jgi:hypothetical protein